MNSEFDCLYGSRFCQGGKMINANIIRLLLSKGGSILSKIFFKINLQDTTSGFQMFKLNTLKLLLNKKIISKNRFFQTEIKIYTRKLKQKEIPIQYKCKTQTVYLYFRFRLNHEKHFWRTRKSKIYLSWLRQ